MSAVLGRGTGFGSGSISGKVRIATCASDCAKLESGEVLVANDTNADYLDAIRDAAAVITETPAESSHAAVIAQRLGIPVIAGVANATRDLLEGEVVTLLVKEGAVHRGTGSNMAVKLDTML